MPDESTAATEHAIMQEITAPLASMPDNPVPAVADVEFPIALRGYDRLAVDAYVKRTSQLVAELQATRSPEAAVRRALERVGEEVAGILQRAHEAAAQITVQSRSDAEDRLEAARTEAAEITSGAHRRLKDLDAETDRIWAERQRIVEDAQDLARQLLALAESAAARFPAADEVELEELGEGPVAAALAGEEAPFDESAAEPIFGDAAGFDHEPGRIDGSDLGEDSEPDDQPVPGREPGVPGEADRGGEDATMIMPPIKPDEGEHP